MKGPLVLLFLASTAFADQCAWISEAVGKRALEKLKKGSVALQYCEPCGDTDPKPMTVEAAELKKVDGQDDYFEVVLNTAAEDLAYLYVLDKGTSYKNLGKLTECGATGVSLQVTWPAPKEKPALWRAQYANKKGGATLNVNQENRGPSVQIRFHYIADTSGDRLAEIQGPAELVEKRARFQSPFAGCVFGLTKNEKNVSVSSEGTCGAMGAALSGDYVEVASRK